MDTSDNYITNNSQRTIIKEFRSLIQDSDVEDHESMSDELLNCFIRARKNDLQRALQLLKNYCKMSRNHPNLMTNLKQAELQRVIDLGHLLMSPRLDQNGSRVGFIVLTHWDIRDCSLDDAFRELVYFFQMLASEEETQKSGIVMVLDFKDFSLSQLRHVTPTFVKRLAELVNDVFPIRFVGIHAVHEPLAFKILLSMIWPFLSAKIRSRSFFHGYSMKSLHHHVDPDCLPIKYDGNLDPSEDMIFTNTLSDDNSINIFRCID